MKMNAAVYYGPRDIRVQQVKRPKTGDRAMTLRVKACGVCPIVDVAHYNMTYPHVDIPPRYQPSASEPTDGMILGHEFSGDVVEVGSEVTAVKTGDRVYGLLYAPCGFCRECQSGYPERCNFIDGGGRAINGAMSEFVLFPDVTLPSITEDKLLILPNDLTYHDGVLIEPLILGIGLANKAKAGDVVVVFGQEVMGFGAVNRLKEIGASKIIVADVPGPRLELAAKSVADVVVDVLHDDIFSVVMDETCGQGADLVLELSCRPESLQQAVCVVKPFGQIWLGTFYYTSSGPFFDPSYQAHGMVSMNITQKPGLSLHNAWGTLGPWMPRMQKAVEYIQAKKITAEQCVTHVFPLNKSMEAFEVAMRPRESIKVVIEP